MYGKLSMPSSQTPTATQLWLLHELLHRQHLLIQPPRVLGRGHWGGLSLSVHPSGCYGFEHTQPDAEICYYCVPGRGFLLRVGVRVVLVAQISTNSSRVQLTGCPGTQGHQSSPGWPSCDAHTRTHSLQGVYNTPNFPSHQVQAAPGTPNAISVIKTCSYSCLWRRTLLRQGETKDFQHRHLIEEKGHTRKIGEVWRLFAGRKGYCSLLTVTAVRIFSMRQLLFNINTVNNWARPH